MNKLILGMVFLLILPMPLHAEGDWDFKLTPYVWFAGFDGNVSTVPGSPVVPVYISPSDALSDNEASFMMIFEAKKQQHGIFLDFIYTDTESDTTLLPNINLTMKSISRSKIFSAAYEYEVYNREKIVVDVFGGLRYWKADTILEFGGGLGILAGQRIRNAESWVDPLIGVKGRMPLGDSNFYTVGWLSAGGFGVGSDSFYDISANIGYQWNKAIGTTLGYRLLNVDYENGSFVYDVQQEGWSLALTWAF